MIFAAIIFYLIGVVIAYYMVLKQKSKTKADDEIDSDDVFLMMLS